MLIGAKRGFWSKPGKLGHFISNYGFGRATPGFLQMLIGAKRGFWSKPGKLGHFISNFGFGRATPGFLIVNFD